MGNRTQILEKVKLGKSVMDSWIQVWGVQIKKENICEMQTQVGLSDVRGNVMVCSCFGCGKVRDLTGFLQIKKGLKMSKQDFEKGRLSLQILWMVLD